MARDRAYGGLSDLVFGTFGQLAMQELITNADVKTAMSGLDQFVDQERILRSLQPAAPAAPNP